MLVGTRCEEPCDWWRVRRDAHDFRGYEAKSHDQVFLVDADAGEAEAEVRVVEFLWLTGGTDAGSREGRQTMRVRLPAEPARGRLVADAVFARCADAPAVWLLQPGADATARRQLASQQVPQRVSLCGERHVRVRTAAIHLAFREHLLRRVLDVLN